MTMAARYQFSLRRLLGLIAVVAIATAVAARASIERIRRQQRAIEAIEALGGSIGYQHQWSAAGEWIDGATWPGNSLLKRLLGDAYCSKVIEVQLFADGAMRSEEFDDIAAEKIGALTGLKWLVLMDTSVTDEGLKHFAALRSLKRLDLEGSRVTKEGVRRLQRALPRLRIYY